MNFYERVYEIVRQVPPGRLVTYGQIARALDAPRASRAVGYALRALDEPGVPWQRVINERGTISTRPGAMLQRRLLEAEGVYFGLDGRCDLKAHRWEIPKPAP